MNLVTTFPLERAAFIVDEALAIARAESMLPLTVVVLDAGGKAIAMKSEDGSGIMRFSVAWGKAWGALGMGISSRLIRDRLGSRPTFQNALAAASDGQMIPVPGGVLVLNSDQCVIGAVGVSGDTSEKDEYAAITAIQRATLNTEPAEADRDWRNSSLSDEEHRAVG